MKKPKISGRMPIRVDLKPGEYWYCGCGLTSKEPFCDGKHKGSGFAPLIFELTEAKTMLICQCKRTKTPPKCDGSHRFLTNDDE